MTPGAIPHHSLAEIFPLLEGDAFAELVADIRANGLHEPIVLHESRILDGRNRYRACQEAGVAPRFEIYTGTDPLGYVISLNLKRRHLDESQRAMVAAKLATLAHGQRQTGKFAAVPTQQEAAALLNISERSVRSAAEVREQGAPELQRAVEAGKVKVSVAADIATLSKDEQQAILANLDAREILQRAKEIRAVKAAENWAKWNARTIELSKTESPLPCERRYPVILADPPWEFRVFDRNSGSERCAEAHYPTMPLDEICALPVSDLAMSDAVLFLWTTAPTFPESLRVIDAWGFRYVTHLVWEAHAWPGLLGAQPT
jgi:hypothetical protein